MSSKMSGGTDKSGPEPAGGGHENGSIDQGHLLIVGAGPGLGESLAKRFAEGGYRVTLLARTSDGLEKLADSLRTTGARIDTVTADASDPEGLRGRLTSIYRTTNAPGVLVYNAVMAALGTTLESSVDQLHEAYDVDVVSAIVAAQVAAAAMSAHGGGTIMFTGGGFADHPVPAMATVSLGKAALRSAATMLSADLADKGVRMASLTIAGAIARGTAFDPGSIAEAYWQIVQSEGAWQAEFRFEGS